MIDLTTVLPLISLAVSIGTIGIGIGVFKTKIGQCEKDNNNIGRKLDREIHELKEEFIKPLSDRVAINEQDQRGFSEAMSRIDAGLDYIKERLGKIEEKLEKNT
jgi:hypothetical protein